MTISFPSDTAWKGVLDLIGDVGDDLDRLSQEFAFSLFADDRFVDLAGRPVVRLGGAGRCKPLIMAKIQVRFGAVVGDIDLAVLERAHRSRVHVQVWVELLQRDPIAVTLQQPADRGGRDPLPERREDSTRDEDMFGFRHGLYSSEIPRP